MQILTSVKTSDGTNVNGYPDTVTTQTIKLRGDLALPLDAQSQLVLRGDLPYLAKDPSNAGNPSGDYLNGVGDADFQAAVIHQLDSRWKIGAGLRIIAPTGGSTFGSDTWRAMPIAGVRYGLPEVSPGSYFEPLFRYEASFAGSIQARNISNLQFAPMVNFALPGRWFLTLYPSSDIRWNFGDAITGQKGRLFLPFDARIGHKFSDLFNVSLEVGVPIIKQYPVYEFMTALRFNLTF